MRIEELERQRSVMQAAMAHMNQVHHGSKKEYEVALMRMQAVSQDRHLRDHELAESLFSQLGQLRGEATSSFLHLEERERKARD